MDETLIIGVIGSLVGLIAALLTPIIKLNTTITKLNAMLDEQARDGERRNQRLNAHSERLDAVEHTVTEQGVRIQHLEHYHRND